MKPRKVYLIELIILPFILFPLNLIFSQNENSENFSQDSLLGIQYYNIADTSYLNIPKCKKYNLLAIPLLRKTKQWEKYVYCLASLSYCYNNLNEFEPWEANNQLAFKEAKKYFSSEHYLYQATLNNLGVLYSSEKQDYRKAIKHYLSVLESFEENNTNRIVEAGIYENLGQVFLNLGDFKRAINYYRKAKILYQKAYDEYAKEHNNSFFKLVKINQRISEVYSFQKNYIEAKNILLANFKLLNDSKKEFDPRYFIENDLALAEIHLHQKEFEAALILLKKILKNRDTEQLHKVQSYTLIGKIELEKSNFTAAYENFLNTKKHLPKNRKISLALIEFHLGNVFQKEKEYSKCLNYYQKALTILVEDFNISDISKNPLPSQKSLSKIDLIKVLTTKAQTLTQYHHQSQNINHLKTALQTYQLISQLTDQLRQDYRSEASKIFLASESNSHFEEAIGVAKQLFDLTNEKEYLQEAFYFSEKSRAVVLLDEIKTKEAQGISQLPDSLLQKEYQLRVDINYYDKLMRLEEQKTEGDKTKIDNWQNRIFDLKQAQNQLRDNIKTGYPNYAQLTGSSEIDIQKIQQDLLDKETVLVEYFLGEKHRYAFKISKSEIVLDELAMDFPLDSLVNLLLTNTKMPTGTALFNEVATELYQYLLKPLEIKSTKNLTIIPDGILGFLPFDLLTTHEENTQNPAELPYLIFQHKISYGYAANILLQQNTAPNQPLNLLALAPVFENSNRFLEYSLEELAALKKYNGSQLIDNQSNIQNFRNRAANFDILHFSTHATANDNLLQQPAIELFDSLLYLSDLYTLRLPAHLAVLSACETAVGDQAKGEGIMSLTRGFSYAGVPSIITSLWAVNEQSTANLMINFYQNLESGSNKAAALRQAKLHYLQNAPTIKTTPFYWGAFLSIGNTKPIILDQKSYPKTWILVGVLSLIILFLAYRRFSK